MPSIEPPMWYLRELADYTDEQNRLARKHEKERRRNSRHIIFKNLVDKIIAVVGIRKPDE